jgi:hypothetical protein
MQVIGCCNFAISRKVSVVMKILRHIGTFKERFFLLLNHYKRISEKYPNTSKIMFMPKFRLGGNDKTKKFMILSNC